MSDKNIGDTENKSDQAPTLADASSLPTTSEETVKDIDPQEIELLAFEMAKSYTAFVEHFRKAYKMDAVEADAKTQEMLVSGSKEYEDLIRHGPPQQESWHQLSHLTANDPQASAERWQQIKGTALDELESGWRSAIAVEGYYAGPWDRAQFAALRRSFMEQWKPANGIETMLIDTMAQAQTLYMQWMKTMASYLSIELGDQKGQFDRDGYIQPPRVSSYQAMEQAAAMADRFNRLFLRTLRQLRDLRRYAASVTIQSAGQVNIGGQQINAAIGSND